MWHGDGNNGDLPDLIDKEMRADCLWGEGISRA